MERDEYERMARAEEGHWWYRGLHALALERLAAHAPAGPLRVLDAGCGTGGFLAKLRDHGAIGLDASEDALAYCRRRGHSRLVRASVGAVPFAADTFDVVVSLDVIYHQWVSDPAAALREFRRVLRPGGLLLVNVPAYDWLRAPHDAVILTARRFTRRGMRRLLHDAGFTPMELSHWNTLLFPAAAAMRLLGRAGQRGGSDLAAPPGRVMNTVGAACLAVERQYLRYAPLPFGLSVFAVARSGPA